MTVYLCIKCLQHTDLCANMEKKRYQNENSALLLGMIWSADVCKWKWDGNIQVSLKKEAGSVCRNVLVNCIVTLCGIASHMWPNKYTLIFTNYSGKRFSTTTEAHVHGLPHLWREQPMSSREHKCRSWIGWLSYTNPIACQVELYPVISISQAAISSKYLRNALWKNKQIFHR